LSADGGCRSCQDLRTTIEALEIQTEGIRTSLLAQVDAACRALEHGEQAVADKLFRTLNNALAAKSGHVLDSASAAEITKCVDSLVSRELP
jgi:hypothetical protein